MRGRTEIDIIILSYAHNEELKLITQHCISSLMISEDKAKIRFNVIVVESEKSIAPFQYQETETIYPEEEFGYHRFMNLGIANSSSKYICLCNNDIRFHPKWATELLKAFNRYNDLSSVSPFCSLHHPKMGFEYN
ncbi:MAG: glycosyltransferase, partial [Pedobacter sp.]|nr:glycosyltransferase [Pedobacter sp.]